MGFKSKLKKLDSKNARKFQAIRDNLANTKIDLEEIKLKVKDLEDKVKDKV